MFKNYTIKAVMVLAVVAVFAIGSNAFAEWGAGYGHHGYARHHGYGMMEGHGYGHHGYGSGYGPGCDYGDDLTREEIEALEKQDKAFYEKTAKLRKNLYQKQLALRSELAKENPDAKQASKLQKELSDLRAEFDQIQLDYEIKTRKMVPNAGRGMMRGDNTRGYGNCWR